MGNKLNDANRAVRDSGLYRGFDKVFSVLATPITKLLNWAYAKLSKR